MITISGNCTPLVSLDIEYDENVNGLPVVWIKTGYKQGIHCPLNKEAVEKLVNELQKMLEKM